MKDIRWNPLKNDRLRSSRGISFEELLLQARLISVKKHPRRLHQNIMLFVYEDYIWVVPYVENEREIFLKTLYPSRKYTKAYNRGDLS